jgi:hypothetical protein
VSIENRFYLLIALAQVTHNLSFLLSFFFSYSSSFFYYRWIDYNLVLEGIAHSLMHSLPEKGKGHILDQLKSVEELIEVYEGKVDRDTFQKIILHIFY